MNTETIKRTFHVFLTFWSILILPCFMLHAQELPPKLINVEWLKGNLSMENMRIVDVRDDVKEYWKGHIPGAVYIDPEALRWQEDGVPEKVIQPEAFAQLLGGLGIDEGTLVVAYSGKEDYNASYLIWALDYVGHKLSALLDGGFDMWEEKGGSITQDDPVVQSVHYPVPSELNKGIRAILNDVKEIFNQGEGILLDVRPLDMSTGQKEPWKRKGRIQGAVHRFLGEDLNKDGTWKKKSDLQNQYEKLGVTPDKTIIVSGDSGSMSSKAYFTLKHVLEYPKVKNYDGSFNEWSSLEELPVQTDMDASPDPGKLLQNKCTTCHNLNRVHKQKADRTGWEKIIDRMMKRGTKLNDTERMALVKFLSEKGK